jgi:penicillin-binding protein 1A
LAKNILFTQGSFSVNDRSYKRKIQEVLLAVWLEWKFTKDQILTMYLNRVYFGSGTYGIDAAARRYFNKSARNLSVFEAAVIAGLLKAPSKYSPAQHPKRAKVRAKIVLDLMVDAGYLRDYQSYLEQGVKELSDSARERNQGYKYFADWVYEAIPGIIGPIDKDIIVITTLEADLQRKAESVCLDHLEKMGKELKTSEVAFVAMTPDGAVKAMVGGKDYGSSQFNRVTAHRQPGSAFKIFIYLAALEAGMTPETMMDDSPFSIGKWHPSNFKWKSRGIISLKTALAHSVNSVSIRLTQEVGPKKVAEVAKRLGVISDLNNDLSISLGTGDATLLELTTACSTFANQGKAVWPYGILEIRDKNGGILYRHQDNPGKPIISAIVLQGMREMLRAVIESGSGRAANIAPSVGGKTGSNGDRDAWFLGYRDATADPETEGPGGLVVGVWTGNDNNRPMAKMSTGGRMPTRVAGAFFRGSHASKPSAPKPIVTAPQLPAPNLDDYLKKL